MIANINEMHHHRLRPSDLLGTVDEILINTKMVKRGPRACAPAHGGGCLGELSRLRAEVADMAVTFKAVQALLAELVENKTVP